MDDKNLKYEQERLKILKYNQDCSLESLKKVEKLNQRLDERIKFSEEIIKKYNISPNKPKSSYKIPTPKNIKIKSWEELVKISEKKYTFDLSFEDLLNNNEIKRTEKNFENKKKEFLEKTKLDSIDISFLILGIALQCFRQYLISNEKFRFESAKDGDRFMKKIVPRKYHEILLGPVPYDAIVKSNENKEQDTGISGVNHRYTTLGHDPILGWIFGTMNIMTNTLTKSSLLLESFLIKPHPITGNYNQIGEKIWISEILMSSIEITKNDYKIALVSIIRQALHLGADAFTKMGLPIPFLNFISPDLNSKLLSETFRIDTYSVSRSYLISKFINFIIAAIHGLFYDSSRGISRDLYEVKTRKILSFSNIIASSSNVIYTSITKNFVKLDIGGLIVTLQRFFSDANFIEKLKYEFIDSELDKEFQKELKKINELYDEIFQ